MFVSITLNFNFEIVQNSNKILVMFLWQLFCTPPTPQKGEYLNLQCPLHIQNKILIKANLNIYFLLFGYLHEHVHTKFKYMVVFLWGVIIISPFDCPFVNVRYIYQHASDHWIKVYNSYRTKEIWSKFSIASARENSQCYTCHWSCS